MRNSSLGFALASVCTLALAACRSQRLPGPMERLSDPLPAGEAGLYPQGPEEVVIVRHADPVRVRPAGLARSYPLSFYNKSTRLNSGSGVYSASGGRIEVIWPSAGSLVLSGRGSGTVGSASRGEPTFIFSEVERATLHLTEGDRVELMGGCILTGASGPYVLERDLDEILRVRNQSKEAAQISFRTEEIHLDPGEVVDLPLLSVGNAPIAPPTDLEELDSAGFRARIRGNFELSQQDESFTLQTAESCELHGVGLKVQLEAGERATLSNLAPVRFEPSESIPVDTSTNP